MKHPIEWQPESGYWLSPFLDETTEFGYIELTEAEHADYLRVEAELNAWHRRFAEQVKANHAAMRT